MMRLPLAALFLSPCHGRERSARGGRLESEFQHSRRPRSSRRCKRRCARTTRHWFADASAFSGALLRQADAHHHVEGLVLEALRDRHRPEAQGDDPGARPRELSEELSGTHGRRRKPQYLARGLRRPGRRAFGSNYEIITINNTDVARDQGMTADRKPGFNTLAIHAGAQPDPATGARATPIYQTTSFVFDDVDHAAALFNLETFGNIYTRITNPTQAVLEERVAALEGGTAALAVASGHAAQVLVFHTLLEPGDEFVAARQLYGGSINQFTQSFKKCGWTGALAPTPTDPESFRAALTPKTKAIFVESIANPGGIVTDLDAVAAVAKEAGVPLHRRQHAGHALSHPPHRVRRRHHRAFADQVPRRPRQLDRRRDRRLRHVRLDQERALSDAVRALARPITASRSPRPSAISPSPSPAACWACAISARRSRRSTPFSS